MTNCRLLLLILLCLPVWAKAQNPVAAQIASEPNRAEALTEKLRSAPGRPAGDRARDATRKPGAVLAWLGVAEGMVALDLVAATGYYTEALAHAVGPDGKVFMQNAASALVGNRGELTAAAIDRRLADDRLANVQQLIRPSHDLGLADASIDVAVIALEFHEFYRAEDDAAAQQFLREIRRVLKPGGVLGIIDHAGSAAFDPAFRHRVLRSRVVADVQAAGLFAESSAGILSNIDDDHSLGVFDEAIRGSTDRFLLRVVKRL